MKYFNPTNNQLTSNPRIPNVTRATHETILAHGWVVYTNEPPQVQEGERAVPTTIDENGVQQYRVEPIPPTILDRLTKLELKRALHDIDRADVWQTLEGLLEADPTTLTPLQNNMRDWMRFGTFIDRDDSDMDALEQAFNLDRNEVFSYD